MIFFNLFNSSNISSRKELKPPPASGAAAGAAAGAAPGGLGGPPAEGGPLGLLAKAGGAEGGPDALGGPELGALGGPELGALGGPEGGNFGAAGKLPFCGGPLGGALGGPEGGLGALGGPEGGLGALGGPAAAAAGAAGADVKTEAAAGAAAVSPPLPLKRENKVLAAAVFAVPVVCATIFFEELLTVLTSSITLISFKSFWAFDKDLIKSLIPLTVSPRSSARLVKPFFIKLITRSIFFCSFETTSIPLIIC